MSAKAPVVRPAILLAQAAQAHPRRISLVDPLGRFTVSDSWTISWRIADFLISAGVRRGDRVAICAPNSAYHLLVWIACDILGAIFVPLGERLADVEVAQLLSDCDPVVVVTDRMRPDVTRGYTTITIAELHLIQQCCQVLPPLHPSALNTAIAPVAASDAAVIIYTSGTSGRARGAVHTRDTMWWAWQCYRDCFDYGNKDVCIAVAPLSHIGGFNGTTNDIFCHGGKVVVVPRFEPRQVVELIRDEAVTIGFAVPTMMLALASVARPGELSSWVHPLVGGAPLGETVVNAMRVAGVAPIHVWGMTETGGAGACLRPPLSLEYPHSCGNGFTHSEIALIDDCGNVIVAPGVEGMLTIGGPHVIRDYWGLGAAERSNGRLITGDLAKWDEAGQLVIVGRASQVINTGGEKVHPTEVENILAGIPGIGDVAITGVDDDYWGQRIIAIITGTVVIEEIKQYCTGKIAPFKFPKQVISVAALPLTSTGKINRKALADLVRSVSDN